MSLTEELARLRRVLAAVEEVLDGGPGGYTDRTVKVWDLHRAMNAAGRTGIDVRNRWGTRPS